MALEKEERKVGGSRGAKHNGEKAPEIIRKSRTWLFRLWDLRQQHGHVPSSHLPLSPPHTKVAARGGYSMDGKRCRPGNEHRELYRRSLSSSPLPHIVCVCVCTAQPPILARLASNPLFFTFVAPQSVLFPSRPSYPYARRLADCPSLTSRRHTCMLPWKPCHSTSQAFLGQHALVASASEAWVICTAPHKSSSLSGPCLPLTVYRLNQPSFVLSVIFFSS